MFGRSFYTVIMNYYSYFIKNKKKTKHCLIGYPIEQIRSSKLPSIGDVLCRLYFITKNENKTLRKAYNNTCEKICSIWDIANIPTKAKNIS